jgi:hypothetical protein
MQARHMKVEARLHYANLGITASALGYFIYIVKVDMKALSNFDANSDVAKRWEDVAIGWKDVATKWEKQCLEIEEKYKRG